MQVQQLHSQCQCPHATFRASGTPKGFTRRPTPSCTPSQRAPLLRVRSSSEDEAPPALNEDWRAFRQSLLQTHKPPEEKGREAEKNMDLLKAQDPELYQEGVWAHATGTIEQGGLLLASTAAPEILMQDSLEQVVVFIVSHGPEGSLGLILNRPSGQLLGKGRGGIRFPIMNAPENMQETFSDSRVYVGGLTAQHFFHVMHRYDLPGAIKVIDGVNMGGVEAAVEGVKAGRLPSSNFRFFSGAMVWAPQQLEREVKAGCWFPAACSRSLVLKPCLQLPTPLWREILLLMGGKYLQLAMETYQEEGDEIAGEQ